MIPAKWILPAAGAALLAAAVWTYGHRQHQAGYLKAQTEYRLQEAAQTAAVLERERRTAAQLAAKQAEIEKEKIHAENIIADLRGELDRVRQRVSTRLSAAAAGTGDEAAAAGWTLFGHCAAEYAAMAEIADRQRNDLAEWQAYGQAVEGMRP